MRKRLLAWILTIALMVPGMQVFAKDAAQEEVITTSEATYNAAFTGFVADPSGAVLLYVNGKWAQNYTGLYNDPACGWWLIEKGVVNFNYNDFYNDPVVGWWVIKNGTIDFSYTGWYKSPTVGTWYAVGGMLDFSKGCKEQPTGQTNNTTTTTTTQYTIVANGATDWETAYAYRVLELVNIERAKVGLAPLAFAQNIMNCAQIRAAETVSLFSHTRPDGSSCFTCFTACGVPSGAWGENIAAGYRTPEAVVEGWMNSSGHRANILNGSFKYIGIGVKKTSSGYGVYATQCFSAN